MSIRTKDMMKEPLLQQKAKTRNLKQLARQKTEKSDVESGNALVTTDSEKQALEGGQAEDWCYQVKTSCGKVKHITKTDFLWFISNPDNWATLVLIVCLVWTIWVFFLDGMLPGDGEADQNVFSGIWGIPANNENGTPDLDADGNPRFVHHHWPSVFAGIMCTAGLSIGVVYQFLKIQLINQINQFRALNREYNEQVKKLDQQVGLLNDTNDKLKCELGTFADLRTQLEEYAQKNGKDFTQIFKNVTEIFDGISKVQDKEQEIILKKCQADVEFMDSQEGVSEKEFKRFLHKLPAQYKAVFEQLNLTFEGVAKGKENADIDDMNEVVQKLLAGVSQAPAS